VDDEVRARIADFFENPEHDRLLPLPRTRNKFPDPRPERETLLSEPTYARAWLSYAIRADELAAWEALLEQEPELLSALWHLALPDKQQIYVMNFGTQKINWHQNEQTHLVIYTPTAAPVKITDVQEIEQYLPDPGPEWTLYVKEGDAEQ
jgi:hypothetical protein